MLPQEEASAYLTAIIRTYLATMNDLGVETWIMHGTLLGWWWNQKAGLVRPDDCTGLMILQILPWDTDLDLQVSEAAIHFLAENCNMTEHHFDLPGVPGGRTYLLEVNPHYVVRTTLDTLNTIDARWIDTSSGLFIDITTVRADDDRRLKGNPGALICKDKHRYEVSVFISGNGSAMTDCLLLRRMIFSLFATVSSKGSPSRSRMNTPNSCAMSTAVNR